MHIGGFGGRLPHAARTAAWRGAQGVGRRRLPGTNEGDPRGRSTRPGHDLPKNEVHGPGGRVTKEKEYDEVASKIDGRASIPDTQAHLRL